MGWAVVQVPRTQHSLQTFAGAAARTTRLSRAFGQFMYARGHSRLRGFVPGSLKDLFHLRIPHLTVRGAR